MDKKIVVFAANECAKEKEKYYYGLAFKTGKLLAQAGFVTVTGGGPGLMNEVSHGAYQNGGKTIGYCLDVPGRKHSEYLTEKYMYGDLNSRQEQLLSVADGFISVPGGIGTLYEIIAVLALKRKGELDRNKPLILIDSIYKHLDNLLTVLEKEGLMVREVRSYYNLVETSEEAVNGLKKIFHI